MGRQRFSMQGIDEIKQRIDVETFCGAKILRVDGRRVGHALQDEQVEEFTHYLATALPDLEQMFSVVTPKDVLGMDDIELSDEQCPNCGHEAYTRSCGCEDGYTYHDCGNDSCCCLYPKKNVKCDECGGRGGHLWCRRCAWDLNEKRFLNGRDERTPQEVLEDRKSA